MTPEQFRDWLAEMKAAGLARSDAECGRIIGKNQNSVINYKQRGADMTVALACRAALHRMVPYGQ